MAALKKINVWPIVAGHWKSLKDDREDASVFSSTGEIVVFYILPVVIAGLLGWRKVFLSSNAIQVLATALSIMAGLLFNLIVLLQSQASRSDSSPRIVAFAHEVYDNLGYAILISLVALIPLVVAANYDNNSASHAFKGFQIANGISMALSVHFAMTLIMVLKRMHNLLKL